MFQLYDDTKGENDTLKKDLKKVQSELSECKFDLEKAKMKNDTASRTASESSSSLSADRRVRTHHYVRKVVYLLQLLSSVGVHVF